MQGLSRFDTKERRMPYYESADLFRALSNAREKAEGVPPAIHQGVQELLTLVLLSGGDLPERLESFVEMSVDCAPDVRPVVTSTLASLQARPPDELRAIVVAARNLIAPVAREPDPFNIDLSQLGKF